MQVSRKSWHYRFNAYVSFCTESETNLCGYFWFTVGNLLKSIITVGILLGVIFGPVDGIGNALVGDWGLHYSLILLVGVLGLCVTVCISVGLIIGIFKSIDYLKTPSVKKPGLVGSFVKAKKDKMCPMIEFKDTK